MRGFPKQRVLVSLFGFLAPALAVLAAGVAVMVLASPDLLSQETKKPYAKSEIIEMLEGAVPPVQVAKLARQSGINFEMNASTERDSAMRAPPTT